MIFPRIEKIAPVANYRRKKEIDFRSSGSPACSAGVFATKTKRRATNVKRKRKKQKRVYQQKMWDAAKFELRFVSPVLLRGTEVVCDLQGATAIVTKKGHGIELYAPGEGLFHVSLSPLQGAVEGRITVSRVSFQLDGQSYKFLLAAPVARGEHIWILRDASYKPSGEAWQHGFIGDRDESDLLANPQ